MDSYYRFDGQSEPKLFYTDEEAFEYAHDVWDNRPATVEKLIAGEWHGWNHNTESWVRVYDLTLEQGQAELVKRLLDEHYEKMREARAGIPIADQELAAIQEEDLALRLYTQLDRMLPRLGF